MLKWPRITWKFCITIAEHENTQSFQKNANDWPQGCYEKRILMRWCGGWILATRILSNKTINVRKKTYHAQEELSPLVKFLLLSIIHIKYPRHRLSQWNRYVFHLSSCHVFERIYKWLTTSIFVFKLEGCTSYRLPSIFRATFQANRKKTSKRRTKTTKNLYCFMMMFFELYLFKKISELLSGTRKPTTFRSPVRRSNHWAIRTQMAERRLFSM